MRSFYSAIFAILSLLATSSFAQPSIYEHEPNNTPANATEVEGEAILIGTIGKADQDAYRWIVSDTDANKLWDFELNGIAGKLTIVEFLRLEYAENGKDVTKKKTLLKVGSRDGAKPVKLKKLLLDPGEYILGFAAAGGAGAYRPPVATLSFDSQSTDNKQDSEPEAYRFSIGSSAALNTSVQQVARQNKENALEVRGSDPTGDFFTEESGWFRFTVSEKNRDKLFELRLFVAVGRKAQADLIDSTGKLITTVRTFKRGSAVISDLALVPGEYFVNLRSKDGAGMRAMSLHETGAKAEDSESEPNDTIEQANRVDLFKGVSGRLLKGGEEDFFRFSVEEALTDKVLELKLTSESKKKLQLCILNTERVRIKCLKEAKEISLTNLVLSAGDWWAVVERAEGQVDYRLELIESGALEPGLELEPNDRVEFATAIPKNNRIRGSFNGNESDYFEIITPEEPQLWRFQLIGEKIHELAYYTGGGKQQQNFRASPGQKRLRLDNLYLLPGRHIIRVSGKDGGNYTLLARPMGKPDPNGEFEPNDDASRMQPLAIGQTRTGVLQDKADRDNYRFTLYNYDHIELSFSPPPDGAIQATLYWDGTTFRSFTSPETGKQVVLSGLFPPGDYTLEFSAREVSEAEYNVSLKRLPRFSCASDCEPNDNPDFAKPLPVDGILKGVAGTWRDDDWYRFPVFEKDTTVKLQLKQKVSVEVKKDRDTKIPKKKINEDGLWESVIPAGQQTFLQVSAWSKPEYEIEISYNGAKAVSAAEHLAVDAELELSSNKVSAYRQFAQRIPGKLTLKNNSKNVQKLSLSSASSDYRWKTKLSQEKLELQPAETKSINVDVLAPKDCWAELATRLTVKVEGDSGEYVETYAEVTPDRSILPLNPYRSYEMEESLLGGLNAAWGALGSKITSRTDSGLGGGFEQLLDGMAVKNQGLKLRGGHNPEDAQVTVKLASEQPVEVAGFALQLLGMGNTHHFLREFSVSTSNDGENFKEVFRGELLPVKGEQTYALSEPVKAQFARIHLLNTFSGQHLTQVALGEFKVITSPGVDTSNGKGFNLASPELGGHVVWSNPALAGMGWDVALLQEKHVYRTRVRAGESLEWVIGFHHDRVAQIQELVWHRSPKRSPLSDPAAVSISVSLDTPLGPWLPLTEWELEKDNDLSRLKFEKPHWARFVKFSIAPQEQQKNWRLPQKIEIIEKPTDETYRSVLTEWGFASQEAFYESNRPIEPEEVLKASTNTSRAAAAELLPEKTARGQVMLGEKEEWYKLNLAPEQNYLQLKVQGLPTVRTVAQVQLEDGTEVLLEKNPSGSNSMQHLLEGYVEPGSTVYVRVQEPPRNVVFLWDTSASVGAYLPVIYNSLMAYARDIVPGRDAANLMPFGSGILLRDWYGDGYVLQTILNDYPRKESSSEAEQTLAGASEKLAPRAGTKAIVMVTDAATGRYADMWKQFEKVRPRIFGIGVSSEGAFGRYPAREQDLMQDWSRVNGGYYSHVLQEGEMEYAFDRAATMLRRPAGYLISYKSEKRPPAKPGTLEIIPKKTSKEELQQSFGFILDASGSMLKRLNGKRRITIAREVLINLLENHIPKGTPLSLRVFGHREINSCRTDLEIPLVPLDTPRAVRFIKKIQARNLAKTPIADSLAKIPEDMKKARGPKTVVLITDGEETCDGDPQAVIEKLQQQGFEITLNIVGFAIDDNELEKKFQGWANSAGGRYFSAKNEKGLQQSLLDALKVPFRVFDSSGEQVLAGMVGDEARQLKAGKYRVVIDSTPPRIIPDVIIKPGASNSLTF